MELCRIVDEHEVAEGTLTRMVGVHPLRWHDVVTGVITSPSLVAVEDPQAEANARIGEAVRDAVQGRTENLRIIASAVSEQRFGFGFGNVALSLNAIADALEAEQERVDDKS